MDSLPVHIRITSLAPSNEDVDARRAAIGELSAAWAKLNNVGNILRKSEMIVRSLGGDGNPDDELGAEVQGALQKHASAFLYTECPLDVGVCSGVAVMSILKGNIDTRGWTTTDVYSNSLWSALAFQPNLAEEKRERLRREVLDAAHQRSRSAADKARERSVVADMGELTVTVPDEGKPTTTFKKATTATIDALRRNSALDREELDFLWWVQLNRSRLLNRAFGGMAEPLRLVASGIEAASHLRRLPADVHHDLVLRTIDADPELNLTELLEAIGDDRNVLSSSFNTARAAEHPSVFPLLHALATGQVGAPGASEKRKVSAWGSRALLEAGLSRMCETGAQQL